MKSNELSLLSAISVPPERQVSGRWLSQIRFASSLARESRQPPVSFPGVLLFDAKRGAIMIVSFNASSGYVREAVVGQQLAFLGVHVDRDSVRGLPLAAVAGHSVTLVKVRVLAKLNGFSLNGTHLRLGGRLC